MDNHLFNRPDVRLLVQALLSLETEKECEQFLTDVCTLSEIEALAQRLDVARLLNQGHTYVHIEKTTGASTATIGRVKRFLHHGADGYKVVLGRIPTENSTKT